MEEFSAITGVDTDTAAMYLEMSGYDLDTAVQLFFSMSEGGGGGGQGGDSSSSSSGWPHDWISLLFESSSGSAVFPDAWLHQGLQTTSPSDTTPYDWSQLNILQNRNGPCGVLAAYQGFLLAYLIDQEKLSPSYCPTPQDAAESVMQLLQTVAMSQSDTPKVVMFCTWCDPDGGVGGNVSIQEGGVSELVPVISQYLSPGGVLLLLYSAIHTFGVDALKQHHSNLLPLLYGPNFLCSSALMNILLTGEARESLGAYDDFGGAISWNKPPATIGLLSGTEIELKMKIHDGFKFPTHEVYVLHGRDHFTTFMVLPLPTPPPTEHTPFSVKMPQPQPFNGVSTNDVTSEAITFAGVHFNGLPPAGPAACQVKVIAPEGVCCLNAPTASLGVPKEYKPIPNTVDCVIQASPSDKAAFPKQWKKWKYEIALAIDDPENKSEERPKGLPPLPTFDLKIDDVDLSEGWRCRLCFETRFATMCFGQNEPGTSHCQHCSRSRVDTGWTLWIPYEQIPSTWQGVVDRQYGPMFTTVLRTKWPRCHLEYVDSKEPVV